MKIAVINPNTTASMTAKIAEAAEGVCALGTRDHRPHLKHRPRFHRGLL